MPEGKFVEQRAFLLHALSPLHAGTGHSADVIDLPIARLKASGIPFVPGSSIKGILRDHRRENRAQSNEWSREKWLAVFGPETENAAAHAGALVAGDARLLALPVRSFKGVFCWVTSPLLLTLAKRDLGEPDLPLPELKGRGARVRVAHPPAKNVCVHKDCLYLQDLDLEAKPDPDATVWADMIASSLMKGDQKDQEVFASRFAVIDDDTMAFLWETATQVDQRVRIDEKTGTVAQGALWIEESLPPETVLIGLLEAGKSRSKDTQMEPAEVLNFALPDAKGNGAGAVLQFGGKATVGRGRCRLIAL